jgi:hypothetical protein
VGGSGDPEKQSVVSPSSHLRGTQVTFSHTHVLPTEDLYRDLCYMTERNDNGIFVCIICTYIQYNNNGIVIWS